MKKYITVIIIAIIMVLPTVFAVKSYMDEKNAPPTDKSVIELSITDSHGKTHIFKQSDSTGEFQKMVMFFLGTADGAQEISALPETSAGHTPFRVTFRTAVKSETYSYYLSSTPSLCFLVHPDGTVYHLDGTYMEEFINTKYAESLYAGATRPTLTLSEEFTVAPSQSHWEYKANSSEFIVADTSSVTTSALQTFSVNGSLALKFDIVPDLCRVKITDSEGTVMFEDVLDNLGTFVVEQETNVSVEVSATWYEEANRDYKGENKYSFNTSLGAPAAFYLVKNEIKKGDFIALTAKNVSDVSKITFKCDPDVGKIPGFYTDPDNKSLAHALFAVPNDAEPGDYLITLTYGNTTQVLPVKVIDRAPSTVIKDVGVSDNVFNKAFSEEAVKEYRDLITTLTSNVSETRLFEGSFLYYPSAGFSYHIGYNKPATVNGNADTKEISTRVCYSAKSGTEVPAQNDGKVVYTGNLDHTGNIVVVDHGIGLMTWYYGMDSIAVETGDSVEKGDKLGIVGQTGVMEKGVYGVHAAMTVGDTFVSFYPLCTEEEDGGDGGILMYGVLEPPKAEPTV